MKWKPAELNSVDFGIKPNCKREIWPYKDMIVVRAFTREDAPFALVALTKEEFNFCKG